MNQGIQPLFEVDAIKVAVGGTPDPEVAALPKRRQFSAAYKRRIVGAANACKVLGETGALLRREGLYSSHLTHRRREVEAGENAALAPKPRGPKPGSRQGRVAPGRGVGARGDSVAAEAGAGRADLQGPKKTVRTAGAAHGRGALAMNTALEIAPQVGIGAACVGLGVARATFYRVQRPVSAPASRPASLRALSVPEQHTILEWLHAPAYADLSPRTVFAMLLDASRYLAADWRRAITVLRAARTRPCSFTRNLGRMLGRWS